MDSTDKYINYITKKQDEVAKNILQWWDYELNYPNLSQILFIVFNIFAMSSEYKHSFSKTCYIIAIWRNNLNKEIIKVKKIL